jgi:hypothetical protein
MKYKVAWTAAALSQLANIWLDAADANAVTAASRQIDLALEDNPLDARFEVVDHVGAAIRAPLGVDFRVNPDIRAVTVTTVWLVLEESE